MDHTPDIVKVMDPSLYAASESGDVKALEKLFRLTPDVLHGLTPAGNNALHIAAYHGHLQFVRTFLRLCKENPEPGTYFVRATNREGNNALHEAAKGGHAVVVNCLIHEDPDLASQLNGNGESAIFKAAEEGHMMPLEILLKATPPEEKYYERFHGETPLHRAVAGLHKGVIEKLLDKRPQLVNQSDKHGRTPLHVVGLGRDKIAGWITDKLIKTDKNLKPDIPLCYRVDENKQSALHIASRQGNEFVIKEILNYSKDCIEIVDKDGKNALHLAVENAYQIYNRARKKLKYTISSLILRRLINCADNSGKTALDIAMEQSEKDPPLFSSIISYLESQGATSYILQGKTIEMPLLYDSNMLSVCASLMATVAFAASFTLPGNLDTEDPPTPTLINVSLFKVFVIFDTLTFVYSAASAIMLVLTGHHRSTYGQIGVSLIGAAASLALTFGSAIHLVVAPKCLWLAVVVWVMVCTFPIRILQVIFLKKDGLFLTHKDRIRGPIVGIMVVVFVCLLESPVSIVIWLTRAVLLTISKAVARLRWMDRPKRCVLLALDRLEDFQF